MKRNTIPALFSLLAHWEWVTEVAAEIPGVKAFPAHYLATLTPHERKLLRQWQEAKKSARKSIAKEFGIQLPTPDHERQNQNRPAEN